MRQQPTMTTRHVLVHAATPLRLGLERYPSDKCRRRVIDARGATTPMHQARHLTNQVIQSTA